MLAKGERVTFEVWGNRLENKIHDLQTHLDPILSVHDQTGRELAAADNNRFADPVLSFEAPASATYYLQVRDTTYAGNAAWSYALHAVAGPVATSVFPSGGQPRNDREARGARAGGRTIARSIEVAVPAIWNPGVHLFALAGRRRERCRCPSG